MDNVHSDIWHQVAGRRYQPGHVVIVAIDDQTRLEHQDEPLVFWAPYFARAIEVLRKAGARAIGVDVLFSASAEAWLKKRQLASEESRTYDLELRKQLATGQVVLAASLMAGEPGGSQVILPIEDYYFSLPGQADDVGLTNFYNDTDGVVRRFLPVLPDADGELWPTFADLLAERQANRSFPREVGTPAYINFAGPPGTFPRISFQRLLKPDAELDPALNTVKDKVVILALETKFQDMHLTPYARGFLRWRPRMMSGPEVHANIVETMLAGRSPEALAGFWRFAVMFAVLALATFAFFHLSPWQGLAAGALLMGLFLVLGYVLFRQGLILPMAGFELGLGVKFSRHPGRAAHRRGAPAPALAADFFPVCRRRGGGQIAGGRQTPRPGR